MYIRISFFQKMTKVGMGIEFQIFFQFWMRSCFCAFFHPTFLFLFLVSAIFMVVYAQISSLIHLLWSCMETRMLVLSHTVNHGIISKIKREVTGLIPPRTVWVFFQFLFSKFMVLIFMHHLCDSHEQHDALTKITWFTVYICIHVHVYVPRTLGICVLRT